METTRFLYSVNPKRVIKTVAGIPVIRSPKSLQLSKEEVRECLKYGAVYRRFANEGRNEKVTTSNVDRLHNAKFISEEEWQKCNGIVDDARGTVINTLQDEVTDVVEEPKKEEVIEPVEETVVEEISEEVVEVTEEVVEEVSEEAEEEVVEETTEETVETDEEESEASEEAEEEVVEEAKEKTNNYNNHNNYKKKHKH